MQLSKRTQYGIRALVCFADAYEQGPLQAGELSRRERLPPKFMEAILNSLTRGRFLVSRKGRTGGYRLARPPQQITLGEIVERLETSRLLEVIPDEGDARPGEVAVRLVEERLTASLSHVLSTITLAQIAAEVSQSTAGQMYYI